MAEKSENERLGFPGGWGGFEGITNYPMWYQPQPLPEYLQKAGAANLSPYALQVLAQHFPQGTFGAPMQNVTLQPGVKAQYSQYQAGEKTVEPKEAVTGAWGAPSPEMPSAQSFRRMQSLGVLPLFESYLSWLGSGESFMQQAKSAWPVKESTPKLEWKSARQTQK